MAFVFKRIKFYCKNKKISILPQQDRIEIGKIVAEEYHKAKINIPIKRTRIEEPEGKFWVLKYPTSFIKQIDAIISTYCSAKNNLKKDLSVAIPEKRKRIPVKK